MNTSAKHSSSAVISNEVEPALQAAEGRILAAIAYQLTGEQKWISEPYTLLPPVGGVKKKFSGPEVEESSAQFASSEQGAAAQAHATLCARIIEFMSEDGATLPSSKHISDELVEFVLGRPMLPSFTEILRESFEPVDLKSVPTYEKTPSIIIIGAGFCGLTMAIRLKELGLPFTVLEKHDEVGGVWQENSYPGCAVDTPTLSYSFASSLNSEWTEYHSKRDEILEYIRKTTQDLGIREHVEVNCEVESMAWSSAEDKWVLTIKTPTGTRELKSDIIIPAVGSLNQPKYPEIDSIEDFQGPVFHTARWRHDVQTTGRRIGLIGNGSSGFQVGPHLAASASHITAFQRSPAWTAANPLVSTPLPAELRCLLKEVPGYAEWNRFVMYWLGGDAGFYNLRIDPDWDGPGISETNERVRAHLTAYIRSQLGDRQDLIDQLVPDYPPYTKRMVVDNGWLKSLTQPNASLVTEPIVSATRNGLVTADGKHHDLDVIVYGTGFYGTRFLWPTEVRGLSGRTPAEIAGGNDDIRAYLGIVMPDFPNMFSLYGPNSSIGHGGGATHIAQCQADYIGDCIVQMIANNVKTITCKEDICQQYNERLDEDLKTRVWGQPGIASRYQNEVGRIVANHPWTLQQFWELTRTVELEDYEITTAS